MGNFVKLEYCSEIAGSLTEMCKAFVKCDVHSSYEELGLSALQQPAVSILKMF